MNDIETTENFEQHLNQLNEAAKKTILEKLDQFKQGDFGHIIPLSRDGVYAADVDGEVSYLIYYAFERNIVYLLNLSESKRIKPEDAENACKAWRIINGDHYG